MRLDLQKVVTIFLATFLPLLTATASTLDFEKIAKQDWLELRSENFIVITDANKKNARGIINDLENYRIFLNAAAGVKFIENVPPLLVVAIGDNSTFERLEINENWAGYFNISRFGYHYVANAAGYSPKRRRLTWGRHVLLHEYFHYAQSMTQKPALLPYWYSEGSAEYWATFRYDDETVVLGSADIISRRYWSIATNYGNKVYIHSEDTINKIPLEFRGEKEEDDDRVEKFYAESLYITHYLTSDNKRLNQLNKYLYEFNQGRSSDEAFKIAFDVSYAELDDIVADYAERSRIAIRNFDIDSLGVTFGDANPTMRRLTKNEVYAYLGSTFWRSGAKAHTLEVRKNLLRKAMELNPDNADLQLKYRLLTGQNCDCGTIDDFLKKYPKSPEPWAYKGWNLLREADLSRQAGLQDWREKMANARNNFATAIHFSKLYPYAFFGLAETYEYSGPDEALGNGIVAFDTAALFEAKPYYYKQKAQLQLRNNDITGALYSLQNYKAFTKAGNTQYPDFQFDSLALLSTARQVKILGENTSLPEGAHFSGESKAGVPHGYGTLIGANGSQYRGEFAEGLMHGQGQLTSVNGYTYTGQFNQGVINGQGKLVFSGVDKGYQEFEGSFRNTELIGQGRATLADGAKYEGEMTYFQPNGQGTMQLPNGQTLQGTWVWGNYRWPVDNGIFFVGGYNADGKKSGKGVCYEDGSYSPFRCTVKAGKIFKL